MICNFFVTVVSLLVESTEHINMRTGNLCAVQTFTGCLTLSSAGAVDARNVQTTYSSNGNLITKKKVQVKGWEYIHIYFLMVA